VRYTRNCPDHELYNHAYYVRRRYKARDLFLNSLVSHYSILIFSFPFRPPLFSVAWRTGLTMQNVAFRPGAFDHMQLPFKLSHGQIGTLQIHVPWRALKSPVVIDLTNVELTLSLLTPEDLSPDASSERAWAVKQAHLAAQELQELAAGVSSGSDGKTPPEAKQGGMLWSLVQHAVTMLLRRLHLSVSNVHIRVIDPTTGRSFGVKLGKLHTCQPGETEHPSVLLAEDAGVAVHASTAARGSIQKQIATEGIQLYWKVGNESSMNTSTPPSSRLVEDEGAAALPPPPLLPPSSINNGMRTLPNDIDDTNWNVLHSTDVVVHVTSKIIGSGGRDPIKIHASAVVHSIPIAVRPNQIRDILRCIDQMNWTSARAKHAHLRPAAARDWRAMWQYAVNSVLADLKGPLKAAPWRPPAQIQHDRRQYVLLYHKKLEAEREQEKKTEEAAAVAAVAVAEVASKQGSPETFRQQEQQQPSDFSSSPVPIRIGLSPVGEKRLVKFERQLCVQDILMCRSAAAHSLDGITSNGSTTYSTAGKKNSYEDSAGGGIFWGLAKAASFVGYGAATGAVAVRPSGSSPSSPSSPSAKASASALLPRPTASDVRELYEAVDFYPEEEESKKSRIDEETGAWSSGDLDGGGVGASSSTSSPNKKAVSRQEGSWIELSLNCLLTETKLTLKSNDTGAPLAAICIEGLQTEIRLGGGGGGGGSEKVAAGESSESQNKDNESSTSSPRSDAIGLTAGVTLTNLYGLDYISNSISNAPIIFFGRGPLSTQPPLSSASTTTSNPTLPPVLRLQYTASASKLDVLMQPLRLRVHPVLLQSLVQFIPPAVEGSYVGSCMAALNALSDASRAAYKAERLQNLGPPLDLVAKVVDFEVLLIASSSGENSGMRGNMSTKGGVLLRTGAIVLHSVGQAASFAASEPIFKVLGRLQDVMLGEGSTARIELSSAVAAVEQRLVYQHIDFSVAALQIMAIFPSSSSSLSSPETEILSNFLLPREEEGDITPQTPTVAPPLTPIDSVSVLLHPLKVRGSLKSHRLALDFGVPQLVVQLAADPIKLTVEYPDVELIRHIMASGGGESEEESSVIETAPPSPPPQAAEVVSPQLAGPVQTSIDLSLSSIDIAYADTGGFNSHFTLKKGNLLFQSLVPAAGAYGAAAGEVGLKLSLESLLLEDSSLHPSVTCALPAVLSPVYRLGKKVFIGSAVVEVMPMLVVSGVKTIEVQLEDVVLDGFHEEPGNFIAR
jgi:Vacuolar sorting-associated protein 13, N-terminal/N-terminal region of Chorein or VPS13